MQPVSVVFLLFGYGLVLPLAFRFRSIVAQRNRLAYAGHQFGLIVTMVGWLSRSALIIAAAHLIWFLGTGLWYRISENRGSQPPTNRR